MSLLLKNIMRVSLVLFFGLLSACSTVKDLGNVNLWPFGKGEAAREYKPANSEAYICGANKKFFVRMLDKGASAWLILPDREVLLYQVGSSKVYSNSISKLDLSTSEVSLQINETTKYTGCQLKSDAVVSKVVPKLEPKPEVPAKVEVAKVEPVAVAPVKEEVKEVAPVVAEVPKAAPVAEVPVAEPVKPAPETKVNGDPQAVVASTLDAWANAWRTKNVNAYLAFYSAKFQPEGMSKSAWSAQRKQRVGQNPNAITLSLEDVDIVADAKSAEASFVQRYSSGKFSDSVTKVLRFENINGQWLIVKETAKVAAK